MTLIDRSGAWLRSPLPPYPFCCQKGYPFRRNHRLKANFVEYFFVSKYFRQHPCINNIFGSSRSESRLCSYPVGFSLLSRSLLIRKNVTFLKTLQRRREDDTMSTLGVSQCYISPSLFEVLATPLHMTIGSCSELSVKRTKTATTTTPIMTTELLMNYFFKRLAFTMEMRPFSAKMNLCFDLMLTFSKLMRTIHSSMTCLFQCEYCQCFTFKRCNKIQTETY